MVENSQSCFSQGKLDGATGHHLEPVYTHRAHSKCPFLEGRPFVLHKVFPEGVQVRRLARGMTGKRETRHPRVKPFEDVLVQQQHKPTHARETGNDRNMVPETSLGGHHSPPQALPQAASEGNESLWLICCPKIPTCLLGTSLGFSIGVGTTRLAASGLE